jgi:hypothetical protein
MAQLSAQERAAYEGFFAKADRDGDGHLNLGEVSFFRTSKLPDALLSRIWMMVCVCVCVCEKRKREKA